MCRPDGRDAGQGGEAAIEDVVAAKLTAEDAAALEQCFDDEVRGLITVLNGSAFAAKPLAAKPKDDTRRVPSCWSATMRVVRDAVLT